MFDIYLKAFERRGLAGLEFPWYPRVVSLVIALLVGGATFADGKPPLLGVVLVAFLVLAGIYDERWTVDSTNRTVDKRVGLIWGARTQKWGFGDIAGFELTDFVRGASAGEADLPGYKRFHKPLVRLTMALTSGQSTVIETTSARHRQHLFRQGQRLAELCGVLLTSS